MADVGRLTVHTGHGPCRWGPPLARRGTYTGRARQAGCCSDDVAGEADNRARTVDLQERRISHSRRCGSIGRLHSRHSPPRAGVLAAEAVRGTQHQHVISTLKHFALNAHETNRSYVDARVDRAALRESDGTAPWHQEVYLPSAPTTAIHEASPNTEVRYDAGSYRADAAALTAAEFDRAPP